MTAILKHARPLAAAFGLVALAAMPAFAADVVMEEPPAPAAPMEVAPVASWAGPYAGVTVGYGFSGTANDKTFDNKIDTKGFLGGAFVGYNYQMDNIVIGAEGDIGYSGIKGDNSGTEVKSGVEGSLRARLGYAVTPDILLYGTAGGAGQRVKVSDATGSDSNTALGWTAGVGTDVKLTESVFGRVEYRYTDLGTDSYNLGGTNHDVSLKDHRIQFGVGMKF
ncbi:MAG: porin family protein [Proteobacteria bacterium]|jgi:outer membrane immunogenic protein|uniref:outer membrane protein n=1 Tax=Hyphomicrobiales TaxID=356 RepID=UPI000382586D|nr:MULTISPECIES: outer membrane protein [Phyllobacteriaceae]MCA0276349.1 porin family protein [Pseudomonadota bacterium]MCX8569454.1 porin family protein [Aminobacter sp. MET-1]